MQTKSSSLGTSPSHSAQLSTSNPDTLMTIITILSNPQAQTNEQWQKLESLFNKLNPFILTAHINDDELPGHQLFSASQMRQREMDRQFDVEFTKISLQLQLLASSNSNRSVGQIYQKIIDLLPTPAFDYSYMAFAYELARFKLYPYLCYLQQGKSLMQVCIDEQDIATIEKLIIKMPDRVNETITIKDKNYSEILYAALLGRVDVVKLMLRLRDESIEVKLGFVQQNILLLAQQRAQDTTATDISLYSEHFIDCDPQLFSKNSQALETQLKEYTPKILSDLDQEAALFLHITKYLAKLQVWSCATSLTSVHAQIDEHTIRASSSQTSSMACSFFTSFQSQDLIRLCDSKFEQLRGFSLAQFIETLPPNNRSFIAPFLGAYDEHTKEFGIVYKGSDPAIKTIFHMRYQSNDDGVITKQLSYTYYQGETCLGCEEITYLAEQEFYSGNLQAVLADRLLLHLRMIRGPFQKNSYYHFVLENTQEEVLRDLIDSFFTENNLTIQIMEELPLTYFYQNANEIVNPTTIAQQKRQLIQRSNSGKVFDLLVRATANHDHYQQAKKQVLALFGCDENTAGIFIIPELNLDELMRCLMIARDDEAFCLKLITRSSATIQNIASLVFAQGLLALHDSICRHHHLKSACEYAQKQTHIAAVANEQFVPFNLDEVDENKFHIKYIIYTATTQLILDYLKNIPADIVITEFADTLVVSNQMAVIESYLKSALDERLVQLLAIAAIQYRNIKILSILSSQASLYPVMLLELAHELAQKNEIELLEIMFEGCSFENFFLHLKSPTNDTKIHQTFHVLWQGTHEVAKIFLKNMIEKIRVLDVRIFNNYQTAMLHIIRTASIECAKKMFKLIIDELLPVLPTTTLAALASTVLEEVIALASDKNLDVYISALATNYTQYNAATFNDDLLEIAILNNRLDNLKVLRQRIPTLKLVNRTRSAYTVWTQAVRYCGDTTAILDYLLECNVKKPIEHRSLSLLNLACIQGFTQVIQWLYNKKFVVSRKDFNCILFLHGVFRALGSRDQDVITNVQQANWIKSLNYLTDIIGEKLDLEFNVSSNFENPLFRAFIMQSRKLNLLSKDKMDKNNTLLHSLNRFLTIEFIDRYVAAGGDINAQNDQGLTALEYFHSVTPNVMAYEFIISYLKQLGCRLDPQKLADSVPIIEKKRRSSEEISSYEVPAAMFKPVANKSKRSRPSLAPEKKDKPGFSSP